MFKSLENIETAFSRIRLFVFFVVGAMTVTTVSVVALAYNFASNERKKIYVLDQGKSLILTLAQDAQANRPVEGRDHVKRFHELFFTLAPDEKAIGSNIERALKLADRSAYNCYKDIAESGWYKRLIETNSIQSIQIDSMECNFNVYPYRIKCYGVQTINRKSNVTERRIITQSYLRNTTRSDNNPHGFMIEEFSVIDNSDIATRKKIEEYGEQ